MGVTIADGLASVTFGPPYDLDAYALWLRAKTLPEWRIAYDRDARTYAITTPERYAHLLTGADAPAVVDVPLASHLFDYQAEIVTRALHAKRFAIWADTGLGKTAMYLEWSRIVMARTGGRVLIICPLQVVEQVREEWLHWYPDAAPITRLMSRGEMVGWCLTGHGLAITNVDKLRDGEVPEWRHLAGMVLDEASILKSFSGTLAQALTRSAKGMAYKLAATATPAPNDTLEYADQARFLEQVRHEGEVLFTYFARDGKGRWHLRPHATESFFRFLVGWSIYLRDPARFGWQDVLATLPPPVIREEIVGLTPEQTEAMMRYRVESGTGLFGTERMGIRERSKLSQLAKGFIYGEAKSVTRIPSLKPARVAELARAHMAAGRPTLVWTVFDEESDILAEMLPEAAVLHGSTPQDERQPVIESFRHGDLPLLISKAVLIGHGLNFQACRAMVFSGFDDSFERLYKAIRRAYRFGQTETVYVDVPVIPELEGLVWENLERKQAIWQRDTAAMEQAFRRALK